MNIPVNNIFCIGRNYGLRRSDWVFTGMPAGVGQLHSGDEIEVELQHGWIRKTWKII